MLGVSGLVSSEGGGDNPESGGGAGSGGSSEIGLGGGSGGGGGSSGGFMTEDGERNSGGNRWPRQETIALLKIRSEMDVIFRDSSLKGPLWEEVSRKMADLGFHRSSKKCKEKFENVYKYHKRTKDGRASKADGKNYRFFEQLEALENITSHHSLMPVPSSNTRPPPPPLEATPINMAMPMASSNVQVTASQGTIPHHVTISSAPPPPNSLFAPSHQNAPSSSPVPLPPPPSQQPSPQPAVNPINNIPQQVNASAMSYSTSSSTSSDEDIQRRHKKKRKWKDYFEKFTKDVINKQEESHRRFLEKLEKREHDRMVREEAWKVEEMARMNREHDLLVQERAMAAAKDAAVISFLQKITEQQNIQIPNSINVGPPSAQVQIQLPENPLSAPNMELVPKSDNGGDSYSPASSSRWPKAEVEALIKLRTNLDVKYQENGPKGPLWEEISSGMKKIGYNRNAKRCKEKWENINKYFKKVKESNKKRPEDSKTCPYFHQLDALYKEKAKNPETASSTSSFNPSFALNPDNNQMAPIMARPEQQWPLPQHHESTTLANKQQSSMAAANTTTSTATTTV
uniref:Myb-like domain-containing protein n=1 Tax=Solanum lycopersicum TaxID=4081 RepID=A0A3Q7G7I2_SOLLC